MFLFTFLLGRIRRIVCNDLIMAKLMNVVRNGCSNWRCGIMGR